MCEYKDEKLDLILSIESTLPRIDTAQLRSIRDICKENTAIQDEQAATTRIANHLEDQYTLSSENILPQEYFYSCLPLCLLDAIYSIGVRYQSTQNVVKRYCEMTHIEEYRENDSREEINHTLDNLLEIIEEQGGPKSFAENIVKNKQRTSSKNGILKSEAVKECASCLKSSGITTIAEFQEKLSPEIEENFREVPGQSSGISLRYLKMLCGKTDEVKPDRHVIRFLSSFLGYLPTEHEAVTTLESVIDKLNQNYPNLTMREVDYLIWFEMAHK